MNQINKTKKEKAHYSEYKTTNYSCSKMNLQNNVVFIGECSWYGNHQKYQAIIRHPWHQQSQMHVTEK